MGRREMTRDKLVKYHILREVIFAIEILNMPSNTIFFIINKDSFEVLRTTLCVAFGRYSNKALAPPYMQMGEIRLGLVHDLKRSGGCWEN